MQLVTFTCAGCHKVFTRKKAPSSPMPKTCSRKCLGISQRKVEESICARCGAVFYRGLHHGAKAKYCSDECYLEVRYGEKPVAVPPTPAAATYVPIPEPVVEQLPPSTFVKPVAIKSPWTPNGHPLCEGGAHWSEAVDQRKGEALFRCKRCGAERWFPSVPPELHPWRPRTVAAGMAD